MWLESWHRKQRVLPAPEVNPIPFLDSYAKRVFTVRTLKFLSRRAPALERDEEEWGMAGENNELVSFAPKHSRRGGRGERCIIRAGADYVAVALISS